MFWWKSPRKILDACAAPGWKTSQLSALYPDAQIYACGSNEMIQESKELLINNNLSEEDFFSDAFICSN